MNHGYSMASIGAMAGMLTGVIYARFRMMTNRGMFDIPRSWLENVDGEDALKWVKERNTNTIQALGDPKLDELYSRILSALDSKEKIPFSTKLGKDLFYNFWKDDVHVLGIWRRTNFANLCSSTDEPVWETVLDLDKLAKSENENWVWKGYTVPPGIGDAKKAIVKLSRGGADATVIREFDLETLTFMKDGFNAKEAKTDVHYKDDDTLLIGTDFGPGSLTTSGYARVVKEWKRGTSIEQAKTVFEAKVDDVYAVSYVDFNRGNPVEWRSRHMTFYTGEYHIRLHGEKEFKQLKVQDDAKVDIFRDALLIELRSAWTPDEGMNIEYQAGSLLSIPIKEFLQGNLKNLDQLFIPSERCSLQYFSGGYNILVLSVLDNVCSSLLRQRYDPTKPTLWTEMEPIPGNMFSSASQTELFNVSEETRERYNSVESTSRSRTSSSVPASDRRSRGNSLMGNNLVRNSSDSVDSGSNASLPALLPPPKVLASPPARRKKDNKSFSTTKSFESLDCYSVDSDESDLMWVTATGFTTPTSLFIMDVSSADKKPLIDAPDSITQVRGAPVLVRSLPAQFSSKGVKVSQHEAISKDGTRIPYFQVGCEMSSPTPTILYGYGGFEISEVPFYSTVVGLSWLELGGTWVLANIRGGGEFGPKWHQAALKAQRFKAYEDFEAVAEDLVNRGVTTPAQLGINGGSNGGLLVGNAMVRRPELFEAVVCEVPLLDMLRYTQLLAGASWIAEYGDPDIPEEREFLLKHSPYHNVKHNDEVKYPEVLFTTSTRDDRVHPAHARKMVHRMMELGHEEMVHYYENMEGGHAGAADNSQRAYMETLKYRFFARALRLPLSPTENFSRHSSIGHMKVPSRYLSNYVKSDIKN